jgi:hypothetical protein
MTISRRSESYALNSEMKAIHSEVYIKTIIFLARNLTDIIIIDKKTRKQNNAIRWRYWNRAGRY